MIYNYASIFTGTILNATPNYIVSRYDELHLSTIFQCKKLHFICIQHSINSIQLTLIIKNLKKKTW